MYTKILRWITAAVLVTAAAHTFAFGEQHSGSVLETMDGGGYTYMKIEEGDTTYWVAGTAIQVKVGDQVSFTEQMRMPGFTSKSLNRTFDELMFVSAVNGGTAVSAHAAAPATATATANATTTTEPAEPITKAEDGYTVAEVFARKQELKGKTVKVRGRVAKVSLNIMKLNWIHLEDGTGTAGSNRIVFRSPTGVAEVGAVVTAEGTLDIDRDFGYGYRYPVLVEDATFTE